MKHLLLSIYMTASLGLDTAWLYTKPELHYSDKVVSILKMISSLERTMKRLQCKVLCEQPFDYLFTNDQHHGDSCYQFLPDAFAYNEEGRKLCQKTQATLVSIEAEDEMTHLQKIIEDNGLTINGLFKDWAGYWTSGTDEEEEGHWIWGATGRNVTYTQWRPKEPNNLLLGEDYITFSTIDFSWYDTIGTFKNGVICEKKAPCIPLNQRE